MLTTLNCVTQTHPTTWLSRNCETLVLGTCWIVVEAYLSWIGGHTKRTAAFLITESTSASSSDQFPGWPVVVCMAWWYEARVKWLFNAISSNFHIYVRGRQKSSCSTFTFGTLLVHNFVRGMENDMANSQKDNAIDNLLQGAPSAKQNIANSQNDNHSAKVASCSLLFCRGSYGS